MSTEKDIYRALVEQTADHVMITGRDGVIEYVNPAFERLTGYASQEAIGQTPRILKSGAHGLEYYENLWQTLLAGETFRGITINKKKDGRLYYEEKTIIPIKDAQGNITHFISTGKDVTKRIEAEKALAESEARSRSIVNNALDSVISMNEMGRIIGWNVPAEAAFGWSEREIIGKLMTDTIIPTQYREGHGQGLAHFRATGEGPVLNKRIEITGLHRDGHEFPIELTVTPLKIGDSYIFHAFLRDITERKQAEEALQRYQTELQNKAESLTIINTITDTLYRTLDFQTVVERAVDSVMAYAQAPSAALFSLEEETHTLKLLVGRGFSEEVLEVGSVLPVEGSLTGIAVTRKEIVTSDDLAADDRLEPHVKQALADQGLAGSVLSVPLLLLEQVLGAMNLIFEETYIPTKQERETLLSIGKAIGLAMMNAQYIARIEAEVAERKQAEERTRLRLEIGQALAAAQKEEDVIATIVEKAAYYPRVGISIFLCAPVGDIQVHILQDRNSFDSGLMPLPQGTRLPTAELPQLFLPDAVFVTNDIRSDSRVTKPVLKMARKTGAVSWATFPLTAGGEWLGTMMVASKEEGFFKKDVLAVYQALAEQGATALRAARLFDEAQESLERRGREVALSTQVAQEIAAATDLNDLYQRVVTQIKEEFNYYHTQLLRYDPALDTVALVVGYGEIGEKMLAMHHSMPMGVGLIGTAAATGRSLLRPRITDDPDWQPNPLLLQTKGELAVPIKLGHEVLGVLDVQSDVAGALDEDDQLLLEGLCGQIAIAIESTRLSQEMESRLRELNTLQRFMSREGWTDYQTTKARALGYRFDHAGVRPIEPELLPPPENERNRVDARANGRQDVVETAANDDAISVPLTVRGEIIGMLGVEDDPERPLSPEDRAFLTSVSEQVAEALEAARLFEQTQDSLAEQERLTGELETVAQVSTAAATILEVEPLLQSVVDLTRHSFNLYHAHIYLFDEAENKLVLAAGAGDVGRIMTFEGRAIDIDAESLVARAARTRQGIMENDVRRTIDFLPNPFLPNTRAEMAVPMVVGPKLVGVLDLQSDKVGHFTAEDMEIQKTLAAQVSVAVQNATLFAKQVDTADKLRQVDRLKSEFLASMSHELRTPLNSIIGFADVLLEGLDGKLNERMEQDIRLIHESGNHLRELIGDILDMSKIEAGRMELRYEEIDMRQMANDIMATAKPLAQGKSLDLYLELADDVGIVEADRTRLRQVLWNMVGNGIKFTEKGSVTLSLQLNDDHLEVSVCDTGIGIKPEDVRVVFEQFRQVDGNLNRGAGGTGLGMPISKKLVELHGGEIGVESVPGAGSTFWFTIPRRQRAAAPRAPVREGERP